MASDLIKITGLWQTKDRDGNMVLSGNLNGSARVVIFTNKYKDADNQPDFEMYIGKNEKKEG